MIDDTIPDGFISLEWELPPCSGEYELYAAMWGEDGMYRNILEARYNAESGCFLPVHGVLYASGWRHIMPDAADMEEFHERERMGVIWI